MKFIGSRSHTIAKNINCGIFQLNLFSFSDCAIYRDGYCVAFFIPKEDEINLWHTNNEFPLTFSFKWNARRG